MKTTLKEVRRALNGEALLSEEVQEVYKALNYGQVPKVWEAKSYLSRKGLAPYTSDLIHRLVILLKP